MPAQRLPIKPAFHPPKICYADQVRRMACASAILARGQERRRAEAMGETRIGELCNESGEANDCLPYAQEPRVHSEKFSL
jgi:hypothetical protein